MIDLTCFDRSFNRSLLVRSRLFAIMSLCLCVFMGSEILQFCFIAAAVFLCKGKFIYYYGGASMRDRRKTEEERFSFQLTLMPPPQKDIQFSPQ